jgi:repressor LexA
MYRKQQLLLDYLRQYIQANGFAPTLRQMAQALGLSSLATVHEHLTSLEKKKLIKRTGGKNKRIELINEAAIKDGGNASVEVPILGFIAAGSPIEPHTDPNASMSIPYSFTSGKRRTYLLQVKGDSMIEEGILNGDYVIVEESQNAINGDIVVALLDNGMATLKRYFKETTRIRLEPANSNMSPIFVKNVTIQGKVVGLIRRYKKN